MSQNLLKFSSVKHFSNQTCSSVSNNGNVLPICYKLPETVSLNVGIIGDKHVEKLPVLDSKKTNFAVFGSLNINPLPQRPSINESDSIVFNIISNILNENSLHKSYELPTHKSNDVEKKADYLRKKFRNRFTHLLWVRHRKMKKHQRNKWRKKNLAMIKRRRLERNIMEEKNFRAELLAQIKEAEEFDPESYVKNILFTIDNVTKPETPQEKFLRYRELIRKNRSQTNIIIPKFDE